MKILKKLIAVIVAVFLNFCIWVRWAFAENVMDRINQNIAKLRIDLDVEQEPEKIVNYLISALLSFLGVVFLVLIIYGGFLWMTAKGNEDQIGKAKKIIGSSAMGLTIIMGAYILTVVIIEILEAAQ